MGEDSLGVVYAIIMVIGIASGSLLLWAIFLITKWHVKKKIEEMGDDWMD